MFISMYNVNAILNNCLDQEMDFPPEVEAYI